MARVKLAAAEKRHRVVEAPPYRSLTGRRVSVILVVGALASRREEPAGGGSGGRCWRVARPATITTAAGREIRTPSVPKYLHPLTFTEHV
jgi:hypothetical protein